MGASVIPLSRGAAVTIDTWGPEAHLGHFCETRAARLDRTFGELDGPIHLILHHNPIPTHLPPFDQIMLLDHALLDEVVAAHGAKIDHIHFGHCHMPLMGTFHGAPISGIRGANHAGWAALGEQDMLCASDLPESYTVIIADGDATTKVMVEYGYHCEIRAEGSPDYAAWSKDEPR